jgi:hypothetical protein
VERRGGLAARILPKAPTIAGRQVVTVVTRDVPPLRPTLAPAAAGQAGPLPDEQAVQAPSRQAWWKGFTALFPLPLVVLILILHLWALGIVAGICTGTAVLAYHLWQRQGVTSLDVVTLSFGAVNAVLFFGWGITVLMADVGTVIFSVLLAQVLYSLARRKPWTMQFARRMVDPALAGTPNFVSVNMAATTLWAACFVICDAAVLALANAAGLIVALAALAIAGIAIRPLVRWRVTRLGPDDPFTPK